MKKVKVRRGQAVRTKSGLMMNQLDITLTTGKSIHLPLLTAKELLQFVRRLNNMVKV